jgi:hypothetical protein
MSKRSRLSEWEDTHENLLAELLSSDSEVSEATQNKTKNANASQNADHQGEKQVG